jgi:hypothetical protein
MSSKPLNGNGKSEKSLPVPATIRVGDFPLGSPQSRAAARALLSQRTALSQDDEDALLLFESTGRLYASMQPNYSDLEATAVYRRGAQLYDRLRPPIVPVHLDQRAQRATRASLEFQLIFGREPRDGDLFCFEHLQISRGPAALKNSFVPIIEAWNRQLPELLCPLKFEGDRLFRHYRDGGWHEERDEGPESAWRYIEWKANGNNRPSPAATGFPT